MKIACVQINSGDDMNANIARAGELVAEAAAQGAQLIALPENVFLMEAPGHKGLRTLYTEQEHPAIKAAARMAVEHHCWMLVGSVAVTSAESRVQSAERESSSALSTQHSARTYNRALLFNPEGNITARYDKIHLFDVELPNGETYAESARMLHGGNAVLADVAGAKLGMTICYDVRFPHLHRALAKAGAQILAVPAAFTQTTGEAHWHVLLRARAIETGCFVIAPAQTGTHPGDRKTFGHALIVDPWGEVLADAGTEEGVIVADIDLDLVKQVRARIPALSHDRLFTMNDN